MDNIMGAYSANKKIEDELRQREKRLEKQQVKMLNRIGREKSELFDTLIHLNVRTPHPDTKSTDSHRIKLKRVELDSKELPPKSLSLVPGKRVKTRPKYVTPLIDHTGGDVYCQIQEDTDTRRKLETDSRTSSLLYKSVNIARCLESLGGSENKMAESQPADGVREGGAVEARIGLTRSRTFTERIAERTLTMNRSKTEIGGHTCESKRLGTKDEKQSSGASHYQPGQQTSSPLRVSADDVDLPYINSFQNLVYFNMWCKRQRQQRVPVPRKQTGRVRQSLLGGYVPFRGVPGITRGWGQKEMRRNNPPKHGTRRGSEG